MICAIEVSVRPRNASSSISARFMVWPATVTCAPVSGLERRSETAPVTWSATVRPKRDSHIFCSGSEFVIVPVASPSSITAPSAFESLSRNVSLPSSSASSRIATLTVFERSPAAKVRVPRGRRVVRARRRRAVGGLVVHRHRLVHGRVLSVTAKSIDASVPSCAFASATESRGLRQVCRRQRAELHHRIARRVLQPSAARSSRSCRTGRPAPARPGPAASSPSCPTPWPAPGAAAARRP